MIEQILRFLRQFESRQLYFWSGFLAGMLFLWLVTKLRIVLPKMRRRLAEQIQAARQSLATSTETRLRSDIQRQAQQMHLASPLFALDEIVIPPRLMAPPPFPHMEGEAADSQGIDDILPYLPDWPELSAVYHAPVLDFPQALSSGANLILIGTPGSGKTVALAYLASQIARQAVEMGELASLLPVLLHASDINLPIDPSNDLLQPLIDALAYNVSTLTLPRLPKLVHTSFEQKSALLLLDGMDELPRSQCAEISAYLGELVRRYPGLRMIVAASPDYFDGLISLGMIPVAIAGWDEFDRANFIRHWGDMWYRFIAPTLPTGAENVDALLLNGWLLTPDASLTPLDLTLKTWAAYAGDIHGATPSDSIESYLLRITAGIPKARPILEAIASQMVVGQCPAINPRDIQKLPAVLSPSVSPFDEQASLFVEETAAELASVSEETGMETPTSEPADPATEKVQPLDKRKTTQGPISPQQAIPRLVECGILIEHRDSRIRFAHPVLAGYLAGTALASSGEVEQVANQSEWTGKALAMQYLSHWNDLTEIALPMLEDKTDPLFRQLITLCRWLRDTSKTARWRSVSMRHLAGILQKELMPMGLRARALTALIYSNDPGVPVLLRSLLSNHMDSVRRLAALGCGLAKDTKSVKDLLVLTNDPDYSVRQAALLALVAIGSRQALDAVATVLLHGLEEMRRAAAEALANHPEEGYPALSEGSTMPDVLVRRAVVYGLARIRQPWAIQMLEKMEIEDEQWVVRSAATQALEETRKPNPRLPVSLPPLHQAPWLIMFAGKQGIGVTPGKAALDLTISAVRSQDKKEQLAALYTLSFMGEGSFAHHLYQPLYGGDTELQDAAYHALWQIAAAGVALPPPTQFGFIV